MKKFISIVMTIGLLFSFALPTVSGAGVDIETPTEIKGVCNNLEWEITSDGTFIINGVGAITDFDKETAPWYSYDSLIQRVEIGEGVTRVGNYSFDGCYNIKEVTFSNTVESIGVAAFRSCSYMNTINFSDSIKEIGEYSFAGCKTIEKLNMNCPVSLGEHAFTQCNSLESVYMPNAKYIGPYAFSYCHSLFKADFGRAVLDGLVFGTYELSIKSVVAGSLKNMALYNVSTLQVANIINADYIGDYALYGCNNLTSVNSYAKTVGVEAFVNCNSLKELRLPRATKVGARALYGMSRLQNVEFGKIQTIESYAFTKCTELKTVSGTSDLKYVDEYAFANDYKFEKITASKKLVSIGDAAFANCKKLTGSFDFSNVVTVGKRAFVNCQNLTSKINFTKVSTISREAFLNCRNITGDSLGTKLTKIESYGFMGCSKLSKIYIPQSCKAMGKDIFIRFIKSVNTNSEGSLISFTYNEDGVKAGICGNSGSRAYYYAKSSKSIFYNAVKTIKTNKNSYTVKRNKTFYINTTISPSNAGNKSLTYTSSNRNICLVNTKGLVRGVKKGKCTITIKSKDGSQKVKKVTVTVK